MKFGEHIVKYKNTDEWGQCVSLQYACRESNYSVSPSGVLTQALESVYNVLMPLTRRSGIPYRGSILNMVSRQIESDVFLKSTKHIVIYLLWFLISLMVRLKQRI